MKIGLVLSGGGGKGAYELGVFMALQELGIAERIEVFAGTSIGAINAALFAQGDLSAAIGMWEEVTIDKLIPLSKLQLIKRGIGIAIGGKMIQINKNYVAQKMAEGAVSKTGAIEIIDKYVDIQGIKDGGKTCFATCTELPGLEAMYFQIDQYDPQMGKEMVIASASLPHIYDCAQILGKQYVDGGVVDNTPVQPVVDAGCDLVIVVQLSTGAHIDRSLYPGVLFLEIVPRHLIGNILTGTLNLDYEAKKLRIKQGYQDAIDQIYPVVMLTKML
ncbi:MAG: patatin-like phospholipase family protein [Cellulosilyticaceae bacterium]